jgi:hypothetical protein
MGSMTLVRWRRSGEDRASLVSEGRASVAIGLQANEIKELSAGCDAVSPPLPCAGGRNDRALNAAFTMPGQICRSADEGYPRAYAH